MTDEHSHHHHDLKKAIYDDLKLGLGKMNMDFKRAQTEKARTAKLQMVEHHHEHHKELDRFIHVAKNVESKDNQAKVHDDQLHHIIDVHVNYNEK